MPRRKLALLLATVVGIATLTLITSNAWDYHRFHRSIRRVENLSEDQLRALGDAAARVTKPSCSDYADGFESLCPISMSLYPGSSDFQLYHLSPSRPRYEDAYIYLNVRISTSPGNQRIFYFTNSSGKQFTKMLWNRNPAFAEKHNPRDRIITISQWGGSIGRSWIVLKNKILVIDETGYVGGEPSIAGSSPLTETSLATIQNVLAKLSASARGKAYRDEGIADGVSIRILFAPSGANSSEDIVISNIWVEDFRPLLTTISELAPKECPIPFINFLTTHEDAQNRELTVRTLVEMEERLSWGEPSAPWWCLWRRWLD